MTLGPLIAAYLILCALLVAAAAVPYAHLPGLLATLASFSIAALKMVVILVIFMRVFKGSRLYAIGFGLGFIFLSLLIIGTTIDLFSRPLR